MSHDDVWQITRPIDLRAAGRDDRKHPSRYVAPARAIKGFDRSAVGFLDEQCSTRLEQRNQLEQYLVACGNMHQGPARVDEVELAVGEIGGKDVFFADF